MIPSSWPFLRSPLKAPHATQDGLAAMLNKKKPAGREPAGFEQIGRLGKLLAQLLSGFAADEFNHKITSHLDIPIQFAIVFAPIVGHDMSE